MSGYIGPYYMIDDRTSQETTWGHEDANRIGGAINYIRAEAAKYGITMYDGYTGYEVNDWLTLNGWPEGWYRIWIPVKRCLDAIGTSHNLGEWDQYRSLDVATANQMERLLLKAWEDLQGYNPQFTGSAYAGQFVIG